MRQLDDWLLHPYTHTTNPYRIQRIPVKVSLFSKNNFNLDIYHPVTTPNEHFEGEIALNCSGWTEPKLDKLTSSMGQIGITGACFTHPRGDVLGDLWELLIASKKLRTNWKELTESVWENKDLDRAESVLMDILSDQVPDKYDQKSLLKSALRASRLRRDNIVASMDALRNEDFNIHLLGHSLGGIDVTMATMVNNENVRSLSLAGPGGLMLNDTVHGIIPRVANTVIWERAEMFKNARQLARVAIDTVRFIAENPIQTVYEAGAAATSRINNDLWRIMSDYHIPTVLVLGEKDQMFPTDSVINDVKEIPFAGMVVIPKAGHNMTTHQSGKVATIMGNTILDVKNRRSGQLEATMNNLIVVRRGGIHPMTSTEVDEQLWTNNG
jgi:hypothetical protein